MPVDWVLARREREAPRVMSFPLRLRAYLTLVRLVAVGFLLALLARYRVQDPQRDLGTALLLAVLIGIANSYPIHIGPKHKVSANTAAIFAAILLLPAPLVALAAAAGRLGSGIWLRRGFPETTFNAAALSLAAGLAAGSLHGLVSFPFSARLGIAGLAAGSLFAEALIAAIICYLVHGILVHVAVGLQLGQNPLINAMTAGPNSDFPERLGCSWARTH